MLKRKFPDSLLVKAGFLISVLDVSFPLFNYVGKQDTSKFVK